jgi:hypothetical protein
LDTINNSIWNNSVYDRTKKKTMKRSQLRELVLEILKEGRSDYYPGVETPGLTPDVFNAILKNVALGKKYSDEDDSEEEEYQGDPNMPLEEAEKEQYTKQDVIKFLSDLKLDTKVTIPSIRLGGFSPDVGWTTTAKDAIEPLTKTPHEGTFKLVQNNSDYKHFTLVRTPEELEKRTKSMQDFGGLD